MIDTVDPRKKMINKVYATCQPMSIAPDWANWRAIDKDGTCHWFDDRPKPDLSGGEFIHAHRAAAMKECAGKCENTSALKEMRWWNTLQKVNDGGSITTS